MKEVVIVDLVRTATGKFLGTLSNIPAPDLGAACVRSLLDRAGIEPDVVDEIIMGQVVQAGVGQAPARQAGLRGGLKPEVAALTVNKVCGSGLKSVMLAAQGIMLGDIDVAIAGGMESMSQAPYVLNNARFGLRMGNAEARDLMIHDGLWCAFENYHMGNAGEVIAEMYDIGREEQDAYAAKSQQKAVAAIENGKFKKEIIPIEIPQRRGDPVKFDVDETPRAGTTAASLGKLRPAFKKGGTVTAGNAPGVNDAASAVLVMSAEKAKELGLKPKARILGYSVSGVEPRTLLLAPVLAVKKLWEKTGLTDADIDLYELNEAFAVQAIACLRDLKINQDKVNVHGGAVSLGHPIGASGARCLTTLYYAMEDRGAKKGIVSLCLGGGNAVAMAIERV